MKDKFQLKRINNANGDFSTTAAGFEHAITTQTQIVAGILRQKFYKLHGQALSDFIPIIPGIGAYSTNLLKYKAARVGSPFKAGLVAPSTGSGQNAKSNIVIDGTPITNNFWRMDYTVSHEQMQMAARNAEAFSIIEENEKARKEIFDIGLQEVVFNGLGDSDNYGLLNEPNVAIINDFMPGPISGMTVEELKVFCQDLFQIYNKNAKGTVLPNRLLVPTSDFLGLGAQASATFPLKTVWQVLADLFAALGVQDFKIVHSIYNETANTAGTGQRYVLYRHDPESTVMYAPLVYTPFALYPVNGVDFVSVAMAQFTGVKNLRDRELLYLDIYNGGSGVSGASGLSGSSGL